MQTNILWSGIEYQSMENCVVDFKDDNIAISSTIIGFYDKKIYHIEYTLKLDQGWQAHFCSIKARINDEIKQLTFLKEQNKWLINKKHHPEFDACLDIDIPLTPLTNSLPINRLKLNLNQEKEIDVIYIDLLENEIKHVKQKYKRLSNETYKYENIPNDFEATVQVDELGIVVNYPSLFIRTVSLKT